VGGAVVLVQRILERGLRPDGGDPRVRAVARAIRETGGLVSIEWLAGRVAMSRRHLERRFLDEVGLAPKRLARITRFQKALLVLDLAEPRRRGAVTAAACGYADQSHFIREFQQLAGCSPSKHVLHRGALTGFFVGSGG
jgi:AraC-like DNA-binding protein